MATSGKKVVTVTGNHDLVFEWRLEGQSGNSSTVYWELYVDVDSYGGISLGGSQWWSVTIDGQTTNGEDSGGFSSGQINRQGKAAHGSAVIDSSDFRIGC